MFEEKFGRFLDSIEYDRVNALFFTAVREAYKQGYKDGTEQIVSIYDINREKEKNFEQ